MKVLYLKYKPLNEWEDSDDMNINTIDKTLNKDIQSQIDSDFEDMYNTLVPKLKDVIYNNLKNYYEEKMSSYRWGGDSFDTECRKFSLITPTVLLKKDFNFDINFANGIFNISLPILLVERSWGKDALVFNSSSIYKEDAIYSYDIYAASKNLLNFTDLIKTEIKDKLKINVKIDYFSIDNHIQFAELDSKGLSYDNINDDLPNLMKVLDNIKNFNDINSIDYLALKNSGKGMKTANVNSVSKIIKGSNVVPFGGLNNPIVFKLLNYFKYAHVDFSNESKHILNTSKLREPIKNGLANELELLFRINNCEKGSITYTQAIRYMYQPTDSRWNIEDECNELYRLLTLNEVDLKKFIDKDALKKKLTQMFDSESYNASTNTIFYYNNPLKDMVFQLCIYTTDFNTAECALNVYIPKMTDGASTSLHRSIKYTVKF